MNSIIKYISLTTTEARSYLKSSYLVKNNEVKFPMEELTPSLQKNTIHNTTTKMQYITQTKKKKRNIFCHLFSWRFPLVVFVSSLKWNKYRMAMNSVFPLVYCRLTIFLCLTIFFFCLTIFFFIYLKKDTVGIIFNRNRSVYFFFLFY